MKSFIAAIAIFTVTQAVQLDSLATTDVAEHRLDQATADFAGHNLAQQTDSTLDERIRLLELDVVAMPWNEYAAKKLRDAKTEKIDELRKEIEPLDQKRLMMEHMYNHLRLPHLPQ